MHAKLRSIKFGAIFPPKMQCRHTLPFLRFSTKHITAYSVDYLLLLQLLLFFFFFFFFFNRRYNPWWVLACFTISFHNLLSLHFCLQFLTFIFFRSSSIWSSHLSLGLPTGLDQRGSHSVTFLTILVVPILITCAAHRNLCDFINLKIFFLN
jgi:hypothetical protein